MKSWWTDEPVLHIFPHWNLKGHEGDSISLWAYSNCDEVELIVNGRSLGKQSMPQNGHLSWHTVYQPGRVKAIGYKNGRKLLTEKLETTGEATRIQLTADRPTLTADNRDVAVISVSLYDQKNRLVPDACNTIQIRLQGPARILGVGNGDPSWHGADHPDQLNCQSFSVPAFNGYAQILVQTTHDAGSISLTCTSNGLKSATCILQSK